MRTCQVCGQFRSTLRFHLYDPEKGAFNKKPHRTCNKCRQDTRVSRYGIHESYGPDTAIRFGYYITASGILAPYPKHTVELVKHTILLCEKSMNSFCVVNEDVLLEIMPGVMP